MTRAETVGAVIFLGVALVGLTMILTRKSVGPKWAKVSASFAGGKREPLNGEGFMVAFGMTALIIGLGGAAIAGGLVN